MFIRAKGLFQAQKLYRANEAFKAAQEKLKDGSDNKPNPKAGVREKITFYRAIRDVCLQAFRENKSNMSDMTYSEQYEFAKVIMNELLSEVYQCGNCSELASNVFLHYLRNGINEPIEKILIEGDRKYINHASVVVNRNNTTSIGTPEKWQANSGKLLVVDPWLNQDVKEYATGKMPRKKDLFYNNKSSSVVLRIEKDFNAAKWDKIISFLKQIKMIITEKLLEDILKKKKLLFNAKDEHIKIMAKIDEKIAAYEACKIEQHAKREVNNKLVIDENYFAARPKITP